MEPRENFGRNFQQITCLILGNKFPTL